MVVLRGQGMKKNQTKAYFNNRRIIKWYEYTMDVDGNKSEDNSTGNSDNSDDDFNSLEAHQIDPETGVNDSEDTIASNGVHERYGSDSIDISSLDMSDDDKDLVESIMTKFKGAKQNSVDSLFEDM